MALRNARKRPLAPTGTWAAALDEPVLSDIPAPPARMDPDAAWEEESGGGEVDVAALLGQGGELAETGRFLEALRLFDHAVRAGPTNASAHEQRAQVLLEIGRTLEAVQAAEDACALAPTWAHARRTLARAQLNCGEVELALQSYDVALELSLAASDGASCAADARECADEADRADDIFTLSVVRQELREAALSPPVDSDTLTVDGHAEHGSDHEMDNDDENGMDDDDEDDAHHHHHHHHNDSNTTTTATTTTTTASDIEDGDHDDDSEEAEDTTDIDD